MQFFHRWLLPITIKVCTTRVIFCSEFKRGIEKEPKYKNYYKEILLPSLLFNLYIYYMNLRTLHIKYLVNICNYRKFPSGFRMTTIKLKLLDEL